MDLWNEYEGRSIGGLFPLERLIRPEGRSAFFSTTTAGTSTVIRLIESHFDEDEILARWSGVSELHQPNLLTLTRFGQAMMDETSLVYVVLEPAEADLSQILGDRPLTLAETREVAASLIPALQALHAKGFIHEHIDPANVLAVGEVVKLRSDCIREAPEGAEGILLQRQDVQDLATLLLQCLTQQRGQTVNPADPPLPAPFGEIIDNGISGAWSLAQMSYALEGVATQPLDPQEALRPAVTSTTATIDELQHEPKAATEALATDAISRPVVSQDRQSQRGQRPATATHPFPEPRDGRIRVPLLRQYEVAKSWIALLALAVICLILFAAYTVVHRHGITNQPGSEVTTPAVSQAPTAPQPQSTAATSTLASPARAVATSPTVQPPDTTTHEAWRVVAYTYNKRDQAAAKAHILEQRYRLLHPGVFSPTGRAPFLVTLGGPLTRQEAFSLRDRLRHSDLPHDIYARNYSSPSR